MLIENPGAVLKDASPKAQAVARLRPQPRRARSSSPSRASARSSTASTYGEVEGANDPSNPFPEVENLLTVDDDFESWAALSKKFFDEENGIVTVIIAASGKASLT